MSEPGHVSERGGVVVQTEGGDPEPVDVMRRGRDVVLGESISAETGVNQRPAPPTPKVTIGRRFTVSPERLTGIVLYWAWSEGTATMHGIRGTTPPQSTLHGRYAADAVHRRCS